ncbi:MAG: protein kinase, partial [Acidobacteriota bacterium]
MTRTDPLLGTRLGRVEIVERIGQGGMGVVYRGRQLSLGRDVAVKVLPQQLAGDDDFVARFLQEARLVAALQHENIVTVFDVDQDQGHSFIVMELVDGVTLRAARTGKPFPADQVRAIGVPIARALAYAHARNIIHRDVKSANVMVTRDGKIKLMDFGIAKAVGSGVRTMTGSLVGTPEYMSPEQVRGEPVTARSDLYSFGVLLYELATGRLPFIAGDAFALAFKHIQEAPPTPSTLVAELPTWLETLVLRAMAKDPAGRHASAEALEADLLRAGGLDQQAPALLEPTLVPTRVLEAMAGQDTGTPIHVAPVRETPPVTPPTGMGTTQPWGRNEPTGAAPVPPPPPDAPGAVAPGAAAPSPVASEPGTAAAPDVTYLASPAPPSATAPPATKRPIPPWLAAAAGAGAVVVLALVLFMLFRPGSPEPPTALLGERA